MKFTQTNTSAGVEILANDHYVGKPVTITFTGDTTLLKKGTPVTRFGAVATGADALGVLLWDVTADNPNGTVVIHGFLETAKAEQESGVTVSDDMKAAMPMIYFL